MIQSNLLQSGEKERITRERKKRKNPYIDEKYYSGPYAGSRMVCGPWNKALLSMQIKQKGSKSAKKQLEQILEAEKILWPEKKQE